MASDPVNRPHTVRAHRNATRIVALRHASRAAARPTPAQPPATDPGRGPAGRRPDHVHRRGDVHRDDDDGRRRAVGRAARPEPARGPDVLPADRRLRPVGDGRAGSLPARGAARRGVRRCPGAGPRRDDQCRGPDVLGQQRVRRAGHHLGGGRGGPLATLTHPIISPRPGRAGPASAAPRRSPSNSSEPGSCRPR